MAFTQNLFSEKLNTSYTGARFDMYKGLYKNNIGHSKFTFAEIPWKLKFSEEFDTMPQRKKSELPIKKINIIKYIENL